MAKLKKNAVISLWGSSLGRDLHALQTQDRWTIFMAKPHFSNRQFSQGHIRARATDDMLLTTVQLKFLDQEGKGNLVS
jgi:hypothetical protein